MEFNQPSYSLPTSLPLQFPELIQLENGIELYVLKDDNDDAVKLDIEWSAGSKYQSKNLIASFTNKLLLSGDDVMKASEIAEKLDFYGGYFQHEIDRDHAGIALFGLKENMSKIFEIFTQAFMNCTFPADQLEKERAVALNKFQIANKKVKHQCVKAFNQGVYGEKNPYGRAATEADFGRIEREDLLAFYKQFYLNGKPTLFLVGNVDDDFIRQLRDWSSLMVCKPVNYELEPLEQKTGHEHVLVPGAVQTAVRIGRLFIDKKHPDYFQVQLLNTLLGGYFGSRLMSNIREDKGYTYGIGSAITVMEDAACFFITTEVGSEVVKDAIQEVKNELSKLINIEIPDDELTVVKNYMAGEFLRNADGAIAQMENFKNIHFNQLPQSYYSDYLKAINAAQPSDLKKLAEKYFQFDDMLVVTAGA